MRQRKVSFLLTQEEINIIEGVLYLEPFLEDNLDGAKLEEGQYRVEFDTQDLDECVGAIEHVSNNFGSREAGKHNLLADKLKGYLRLSSNLKM